MKVQNLILLLITVLVLFSAGERQKLNNRPIIGIVAQSTQGTAVKTLGKSYINADYVKYIESSGARVVPITTDLTKDEIVRLFQSVNGVLFPGGDVPVTGSDYGRIGRIVFGLATDAFVKNDYFPLWGTCLGFELLSVLASGSVDVLSSCDSENQAIPLNFTSSYRESRLFRDLPNDLANFMSSAPTTLNLHLNCVYAITFKKTRRLNSFFHELSTNRDRSGTKFVSTAEGKRYPFYGTQWHPERNNFEWTLKQNIPHEAMSVRVTQYMSNFFVNEARHSMHKFETLEEEQAALIYNYSPVYTGNISTNEQTYIFN